ncbi:hypothetical protein [Ralstonia phage RP31]|uniref:Uncharacterized protein n=2 Tax=Ripduovirus RP12 TaxID=2560700 RepID=A0A1L7N0U4_9CAUD|nr:hypothetical protein FDH28_gp116 [Ralstonia phage RP12]BAW19090.1 hypothetical protein [Ralstonia phage RP12]BAW19376.1 hypothetical protein [Ralstonia phage RP31]
MKLLTRLLLSIRAVVGYALVAIGAVILPKEITKEMREDSEQEAPRDSSGEPEVALPEEPPAPKNKTDDKLVPFTDLASYAAALSEPSDQKSACIDICNQLNVISKQKQRPVRLTVSVIGKYDATGKISDHVTSSISAYHKDRWHKLRDLEIGVDSIPILVDEMIEAMAQDGWACIVDAAEQLKTYAVTSTGNGERFVIDNCKKRNTTGTVHVSVTLQADATVNAGKNLNALPQIMVRLATAIKDRIPVGSNHAVFFHRTTHTTTPQA